MSQTPTSKSHPFIGSKGAAHLLVDLLTREDWCKGTVESFRAADLAIRLEDELTKADASREGGKPATKIMREEGEGDVAFMRRADAATKAFDLWADEAFSIDLSQHEYDIARKCISKHADRGAYKNTKHARSALANLGLDK